MSSSKFRQTAADRHRKLAVSLSREEEMIAQQPAPAVAPLQAAPVKAAIPASSTPSVPRIKPRAQPSPRLKQPAPIQQPLPITNPAFASWLASRPQTTWLFTGDSFTDTGSRITKGGTFPCFLSRIIRDHFQRVRDVFINTTMPGQTLAEVYRDLTDRVERFSPDVVVLLCGPGDLIPPASAAEDFERIFQKMVDRLREQGSAVIINTPPPPPSDLQHQQSDAMIRLEAIRNCALESTALLVDHWDCWEQSATTEFHRPGSRLPAERGCIEMARHFVEELKLKAHPGAVERRPSRQIAVS